MAGGSSCLEPLRMVRFDGLTYSTSRGSSPSSYARPLAVSAAVSPGRQAERSEYAPQCGCSAVINVDNTRVFIIIIIDRSHVTAVLQ